MHILPENQMNSPDKSHHKNGIDLVYSSSNVQYELAFLAAKRKWTKKQWMFVYKKILLCNQMGQWTDKWDINKSILLPNQKIWIPIKKRINLLQKMCSQMSKKLIKWRCVHSIWSFNWLWNLETYFILLSSSMKYGSWINFYWFTAS